MFIAIQFPLTDSRAFTDSETNRLGYPTWPLPKPDKEFIRTSGIVRNRRQGGLEDWPGEELYCSAKRAIRFNPLLSNQKIGPLGEDIYFSSAFRRYFFDGETVSRVELGFKVKQRDFSLSLFPFDKQDCLDLIDGSLSIPVRVPLADGTTASCDLLRCGDHLAKHYLRSTTQRINKKIANTEDWWVSHGTPLVLIEYDFGEIGSLPRQARPIASDSIGGLGYCLIQKNGKRLGVWFLNTSFNDTDLIRRLRLNLFRLHAERECLKQIFRLISLGKLQPKIHTNASDRLQQYLTDATRLLSRKSRYGLSQSTFADEIQNIEDIVSPGERSTLLAQLSKIDIRKNLYRNLEKFTISSGDKSQNFNIIGNGISVYVGQEQRIGGTQVNKYDISFGDNTKISGDFTVANTIQNSFNKISSSEASPDIKAKLKELSEAVVEMCNQLPEDKAREAARDLDTFTNEALSKEPRRKWYELSSDGLIQAAQAVGKTAVPVISIISSLLPLL